MRNDRFNRWLIALLCALIASPPMLAAVPQASATPAPAAAAPPAFMPMAASAGRFKEEMATFFAEAGRLAPTAVGDLSRDPAAVAGLRSRIDSLNPEDLASMQAAFSEVPDWQAAPEALSSAFQMQVLGDAAARQAGDLEQFRTEVSEFYAALRLLPAESLARLDQDPAAVAAMQARLHDMPAQGLALLRIQMDQQGDWRGLKSNLLASLSPGARAGLRAFADKGPLGDRDFAEVGDFRKDLDEFLVNLKHLPPDAAARIDVRAVAGMEAKLRRATPEMMFMIRQRIDTPALRQAMADVRALAGAGTLSAEERSDLERFRGELAAVYGNLRDFTPGDPSGDPIAAHVAALSTEDLLLARARVETIPAWNRTLPAILAVASTAENRTMLALLEHRGAGAETGQALEAYRAVMLERLAAMPAGAGVDAAAVAGAGESIRQASARDLFLMRESGSLLPPDDQVVQLIQVPRAVATLSGPQLQSVAFNCSCPDHGLQLPLGIGCVSMQFLCNIIAAPVNLALAGFEAVVDGLETVVNGIESVIDDVLGFVVQIANAIANLPNVLLGALQALFQSIAAAVMNEFSPASLAAKLGLVEGFWLSLPVLPQIPCPPDGFNLHPFGEVGDDLTASKYERYLFVFDKIIDLIPDTEVSLALKIPAQVLYGGIQYLGVCLHDAAAARSEQATLAFRALVAGRLDLSLIGQGNAQTGINVIQGQVAGLQSQVLTQGQDLMNRLARQQQEILNHLMVQGQDLMALIRQSGGDLGDDLTAFQDQDLRLKIEANLALEGGRNIAFFELPQAFGGVLEMVRDLVSDTIEAAVAAGFNIRNSESMFVRGDELFDVGDYRGAYDAFAKAYREAASGNPVPIQR